MTALAAPVRTHPSGLSLPASLSRVPLLLGIALLAGACIPMQQYRTVTVVPDGSGGYRDEVCDETSPNVPEDRCAVERRTYQIGANAADDDYAVNDYYFASVEFDDRGWFWDRRQMEATLRYLYDQPDEEFLIFAYAHGWQHRALACDNNVVCFQRLLERLDYTERQFAAATDREPRKIVGVYIGWSGRIGKNKPARLLSFYNRKRAANRVGIGGVTELLTRLNDLRGYKNPHRASTKTQLVVAGHSFGGQVIYKALALPLIERAVEMEKQGDSYGYDVASSFGDLVMLINPAFEGSAYEALQFAATNRCYPARQRPSLLVITSTADSATGKAFPSGRKLSNGRSRTRCKDQKEAVLRTVGHLPRYTSHILELKGEPKAPPPEQLPDTECGCPYLDPISEIYAEMNDRDTDFIRAKGEILEKRKLDDGKIYELGHPEGLDSVDDFRWASYGMDSKQEEMILRRVGDNDPGPGFSEYTANYPFLVIQTDEYFIPSHSAVYGERFTDFIRRFYLRHLAGASRDEQLNFPEQCYVKDDVDCLPTDITPCERSWTRRPDVACEPGEDGRGKKR